MKKRILSIILFLVVCLGAEAVTRKELTQEVLSKIGIKQEIIDETIKLDEKFAGKSIFSMDEDELDARIKMMEEILEKDDRNFDLNDELFTIYILSEEKKDYEKAKQYLEKSDKYNDKFSSYFNNIVYNRKVGKKKEAEKIYNKLRKEFKDKPLIDLADIFLEAMAGDDEDDSLSVMDENFLENNFYLNNPIENPEVSDHPLDNISKTSEKDSADDKEDYEGYKKMIKELTKVSIERTKKQKEEIEKMKGIVAYFSNDEKQREFNISDDTVRGFELQFRTQEMSDIGINEGAEKAVQYYLENTRNMKILQKYYGKEESKKAPENTSKGKNKKESKKKRGK